MLTRHSNELMIRLETVADVGCAVITKAELLRWYERDRITRNVWRHIIEQWAEIEEVPLFIGEREAAYTLIYGKGLMTEGEDIWFQNIQDWAGVEA